MLLLAAAAAVSACDDWTEIRSLDTESQRPDPAIEARYEAAVREYRASDHQLVLGRFDNSVKVTALRPQHIDVLPDSLDMVILAHPDSLCERELEEMRQMRAAYATEYLCEVTYSRIETLWEEAIGRRRTNLPPAISRLRTNPTAHKVRRSLAWSPKPTDSRPSAPNM